MYQELDDCRGDTNIFSSSLTKEFMFTAEEVVNDQRVGDVFGLMCCTIVCQRHVTMLLPSQLESFEQIRLF